MPVRHLLSIAVALPLLFASPAGAMPLPAGESLAFFASATNAVPVRWHWWRRWRSRDTSVGVFIVPGLYWGPAWWDANYSRACWRYIRPCANCAANWVYVC